MNADPDDPLLEMFSIALPWGSGAIYTCSGSRAAAKPGTDREHRWVEIRRTTTGLVA